MRGFRHPHRIVEHMHNACAALVLSCVLGAIPAAADETTIGILRFQSPSTVPENITTSVEQFVYSAFTLKAPTTLLITGVSEA